MRPGSTLTLFLAVGRVVIPLERENALRAVLEAMSGPLLLQEGPCRGVVRPGSHAGGVPGPWTLQD